MPRKIILASKSPRRQDLLRQIGLEFETRESEYEEDMNAMADPYELAKFLALGKAKDVAKHYDDAVIISADTFAIFENKFLGKPKDETQAREFLKKLSGKVNEAITGYAIIDTKNNIVLNDYGSVKVKFRDLSDEEIDDYIATGEPLKMGGAYGLLNKGAVFIEKIEGDFYSAPGLPITKIYLDLKKLGINALKQ